MPFVLLLFCAQDFLKLRYYEKATNFEKNLPPVLTKKLFLLIFSNFCGLFRKAGLYLCPSSKSGFSNKSMDMISANSVPVKSLNFDLSSVDTVYILRQ